MKLLKKGLTICLAVLLIAAGFSPAAQVRAEDKLELTIGFEDGYSLEQGHVEYKMDGGDWISVNGNNTLDISGAESLILKIVAEPGYEVNFDEGPYLADGGPGTAFNAGDMEAEREKLIGDGVEAVLPSERGISLTGIKFRDVPVSNNGTVSIDITGPELEYWNSDIPSRITFFINTPQEDEEIIQMGRENIEFKGDYTIQGEFVQGASGVKTKEPVPIEYDYDGKGEVSFIVKISNASTKITKFLINGRDYKDQCPQTDAEFLDSLWGPRSVEYSINNVPHADHYDVVIEAKFDELMGGFGWNYLSEETLSGDAREDCIAHGTLSFIEGEYEGMTFKSAAEWNGYKHGPNKTTIFEWKDGLKEYEDERDAWGSAAFPRGAVITFKLIPDEGYQLTSLFGDKDLEPQEEPGVYKITMTGGMNSHLMATFTETEDAVDPQAKAVKGGDVSNLYNPYGEGTMKLNVWDTETNAESEARFTEMASSEGAEIQEYIDINLANTIYKATDDPNEAWDRPVSELEKPATINLELENSYEGKDIIVIHEHDGKCEVIETEFDGNNTISFETSSFSNYAIATKEPEEEPSENPSEPSDNPAEEPSKEPSENPEEKEDYAITLDDESFTVEFTDVKGLPFIMVVIDLDNLTDQDLQDMELTKEEYEAAKSLMKESIKDKGDFLGAYEIMVVNGENGYEPKGPFKLKIKITDDLKDYTTFKLFNMNSFGEEGFTPAEIAATIENGYIVVEVDELGTYAITGLKEEPEEKPAPPKKDEEPKKEEPKESNDKKNAPATGDEMSYRLWAVVLVLATGGIGYLRKKEKKGNGWL